MNKILQLPAPSFSIIPTSTSKIIARVCDCVLYFLTAFLLHIPSPVFAQAKQVYLDETLSTEQRVNDLVSKLSLLQKIKLLQYRGTAIKTNDLDIPAYNWWNECLHGVARAGKATVFPQAIGLAATWDTALIKQVADAIADEARAKYYRFSKNDKRGIYQGLSFWTPNINIFRDPRWGRGMETYGEDPYLTGKIAASFIRGLQGDNPKYFKTIATIKHFAVHSGPEESRHRFNAEVSDRDLFETYTPAFKRSVQEADVYSLMCAYNSFRGKPCCGSDFLLTQLLRNQWGFKGYIVTDCGAVDDIYKKGTHEVVTTPEEASALAIKAGVDLECGDVFNALDKAIEKKLVTEAELDVAIRRLFTARFKLGFFDNAASVSYTKIPYSVVESEAHKILALQAARKSIVLLKNENNTLPIRKSIKTLAVIGPNANDEEVMLANYHGYPSHVVTPLEAIKKKLPGTKLLYARGSALAEGLPAVDLIPANYLFTDATATKQGLKAVYFNNSNFKGSSVISRVDKQINFNWIGKAPAATMDEGNFSVTWTGYLKAPAAGSFVLDIYGSNQFELSVDDRQVLNFRSEHHAEHKYAPVIFAKNKLYKISIKYASYGSSPIISFNWELPNISYKKEALRIARQADVIVMCMGLSPRIEGEEMKIKIDGFSGGDRTKLQLPEVQESLIKEITALGKPVILVMVNGSAVAINWEQENLPAIIESWYGGQEAGTAIADVLFGDYNPGGKLPVTFYRSENDIPAFENYDMKGRTYRFFEGNALYGFGYGLSYTTFAYANLILKEVHSTGETFSLSVDVTNTGKTDGEEVVQLYVKNNKASVAVPLHTLKGFKRIALKKGEKKTVHFALMPEDFSVIDNNGQEVVEASQFEISIGGGQPGKHTVKKIIELTGNKVTVK
ncbi:MAG: glycoside hydrolase family 3 C-terminal domain-containing protein [Ferruginibacter sp.]|nr:glycoside hydrolase family 3 C-terminal domain-containing protein [Ferruginibacter sp.]